MSERQLRGELELERLRRSLAKIADDGTDWGCDALAAPDENLTLCVDGMQAEARAALAAPDFSALRNYVRLVDSLLEAIASNNREETEEFCGVLACLGDAHEQLLRDWPFLDLEAE